MTFREGGTYLTRQAIVKTAEQILDRVSVDGVKILKDPEVRKQLASFHGGRTVAEYLIFMKGLDAAQEIRLAFANDTEILSMGDPKRPVGFWLARVGNKAVHLELMKNEDALRIRTMYGIVAEETFSVSTGEIKEAAERFVLKELLRRSGKLRSTEIRRIADHLRGEVNASGVGVLDDEETRQYLFSRMSNGYTVAHALAHDKRRASKSPITMYLAGDREILSTATAFSVGRITVETLLRKIGDEEVNTRIDETLGKMRRG